MATCVGDCLRCVSDSDWYSVAVQGGARHITSGGRRRVEATSDAAAPQGRRRASTVSDAAAVRLALLMSQSGQRRGSRLVFCCSDFSWLCGCCLL
jgi:hypothetical protein